MDQKLSLTAHKVFFNIAPLYHMYLPSPHFAKQGQKYEKCLFAQSHPGAELLSTN